MSMVFLGVPIFDWVLLVVVLGFGVEAWITCRPSKAEIEEARRKTAGRVEGGSIRVAESQNADEPQPR